MNAPQLLRQCLTCQAETWVSAAGLCPLWVLTRAGVCLGDIIEDASPAPCAQCGASRFHYRADYAYVAAELLRLTQTEPYAPRANDLQQALLSDVWAAYQQTLAPDPDSVLS